MAMDYSEKWGTDVDTAVKLALDDLKLTIDEVDVTVLEEPSRGFFGIGSKLALVRVEKKKSPEERAAEEEAARKAAQEAERKAARTEKNAAAAAERAEKEKPHKTEAPKRDRSRDKRERGGRRQHTEHTERAAEPMELPALSIGLPEENMTEIAEHPAIDFLKEVTKEMGLDLEISAKAGENSLYISIKGKDSGTIIGKRGQTLDAIQYLTSLVVNKGGEGYTRVVVDAENYRLKREKTLEALALRLASKVARTGRSVKLEPMNPYERKVIHATLQNHPQVVTRSEGQDPYRRIIIELK